MKNASMAAPLSQNSEAWWSDASSQWFEQWRTLANNPMKGQINPNIAFKPTAPNTNNALTVETAYTFDQTLQANMARATLGMSPASLALAYFDWVMHLSASPEKWTRLAEKSAREWGRLPNNGPRPDTGEMETPGAELLPQDKRFRGDAWRQWPFNLYSQAFLLQQQWWRTATTDIAGVSAHDEQVVSFFAQQLLDMTSPMNFIATNPLVLHATMRESGQNLVRGLRIFQEDWERAKDGRPPMGADGFQPGGDVATTPGKVVFRNRLIELIQYSPSTNEVDAEPLLIVPAWIMKYYILDLSPANSMVRYLIAEGHTVFMISWRNPGSDDGDLGMDDYLRLGVLDALDVIQTIIPNHKVNTVGYCMGGTLLAIAAAYLAREASPVIQSITLLAAQTDFTEAGELKLFIDNSQLDILENVMSDQGYLGATQMAGAFQLLRSNDLVWSQAVHRYLMGKRAPMTDLMAWNADATRMPQRMHSEYLRGLFLNNDLYTGRYQVDGRPVALRDIRAPLFVVATEKDHIAPWRSVYKINLATYTDQAFVLTSGGHNAGIVSEPGHAGRHFRYAAAKRQANYVDPDTWLAATSITEGSWWPIWVDWLRSQTSGQVRRPSLGASTNGYPPLYAAPGVYVLEH